MQSSNIARVQFRRAGKIYDFSYNALDLRVGDSVVVDSEKGASLAQVVDLRFEFEPQGRQRKLKSILRKASIKELNRETRLDIEEISRFTKEKIDQHNLQMRILKSEVQFGGTKIIVYFSSPARVDFRDLVKDLASGLKARVELKQVGARDEAKLLGGLGICGREYCCSSFLRDFVPVSIKMAKNQNLALNPSKVSGGCGRLLCCLTYENDVYTELRKTIPPRGTKVRLVGESHQIAMVLKGDLLNQLLSVETPTGHLLSVKVKDVEILERSQDEQSSEDAGDDSWGEDINLAELENFVQPTSAKMKITPPSAKRGDEPNKPKPRKR